MRPNAMLAFALFGLAFFQAFVMTQPVLVLNRLDQKVPLTVRQGPLFLTQQSASQHYWYQVGAIGTSSSSRFTGANITIRTVYDVVNDDAHSYWIGGHLANGAFIQVGYLNGLSTNGQTYCCAWFYEYFPAGQTACCDPVIGPEFSAGPVGSWHYYSMLHRGNGIWSFYMDGKLLGSTPGLQATDSGQNSPAGIAEVADTGTNTDILGPAEFKDMRFNTTTSGWSPVFSANNLIWYGTGTPLQTVPVNPYGAQEVNGIDNDYLAGSRLPQLSSPAAPPGGPALWPTTTPSFRLSITFLDVDQQAFSPEWVSLSEGSTNQLFYTDSADYRSILIDSGVWTVSQVFWHKEDVLQISSLASVPGDLNLTVQTSVSSLKVRLVGWLFGLPVRGATVTTMLADTSNSTGKTDGSGTAVLRLLPPGTYYVRATVPYGLSSTTSHSVPTSQITIRAISLAEMLAIIIVPIGLAVTATILAVRRERMRATRMAPMATPLVAATCLRCGKPLQFYDMFCPNCGTPARPAVPPVMHERSTTTPETTTSGSQTAAEEKSE